MRRSEGTPVLSLLCPGIWCAVGYANAPFDADAGWITSGSPRIATHALKRGSPHIIRRKLREPAIRQTSNAFDHRFYTGSPTTKPQGNRTLDRQRVEASVANMVPAPMEIDHVLRPQGPHHGNLFLRALAAIVEILTQSLIFRRVPTNPNSQAQASTAQHIDFCRLLCYQRRLPLAQNNDRRYQLDALGHSRQVPVEYKGLMKHIVLRIRPLPPLVMRGVHSQDMIKDYHVFIAYALSGLHEIAYRLGISPYFGLWENDAQLHRFAPLVVSAPCQPNALLPFGRPCSEARHIVIEEDHVYERDRYRSQECSSHQPTPVVHIAPNELPDHRRGDGLFIRIGDERDRVEVLAPRQCEAKQRGGDDAWNRHGQDNAQQRFDAGAAVDQGTFLNFLGNRAEIAHEQPGT